jgi:hypothetical protein
MPARRRRGVAEKQVSCHKLGSNPLVNDQKPDQRREFPFPPAGWGILQEALSLI